MKAEDAKAVASRAWPRLYPDRGSTWEQIGAAGHKEWTRWVQVVADEIGTSTFSYDGAHGLVVVTRLPDVGTVEKYLIHEVGGQTTFISIQTEGRDRLMPDDWPMTDTGLDDLPASELSQLRKLKPVHG